MGVGGWPAVLLLTLLFALCVFPEPPSTSGTVTGSGMRGGHPDTALPAPPVRRTCRQLSVACAVLSPASLPPGVSSSLPLGLTSRSACVPFLDVPGCFRGLVTGASSAWHLANPSDPGVSAQTTVCTGSLDWGSRAHRLGYGPSRHPSSQTPSRRPLSLRGAGGRCANAPQQQSQTSHLLS